MENSENKIVVEEVERITPHNKALYEAGKALLVDSISVGREFCKFMITLSTSAIPIHLALLKAVIPDNNKITFSHGLLIIIPALIFVISSIVFTLGYFPQSGNLTLDIVQDIQRERQETIVRRKKFAVYGFIIFLTGSLSMIIVISYFLFRTK
jgi:hypothetical protein